MLKRLLLSPLIVALASVAAVGQTPAAAPAPAAGFATIRGSILDSLHDAMLQGALVRVEGSNREAITDATGLYRIDSVPSGMRRLTVIHPLLDTLGISLVTQPLNLIAGETRIVEVAVPSSETLVGLMCPAARRTLGPAALVGFVRDADTEAPAQGAKVSLLYFESDPLGLKKTPRVREQQIGPDGRYRICGLPEKMSGKLQVFRNGVQTGEVPVELGTSASGSGTSDQILAMRSMSISSTEQVVASAATPNDTSAKPKKLVRGKARVSGRILNKYGQPVVGARVELQNTGAATKTRSNGEFTLDSLPSGTQTLEVRQLGFSPTEVAVELSSGTPQDVTVKMSDYVPVLSEMRVTAQRERGLSDVGFSDRKRSGMGYYLDADQLKMRQTNQFSDMLRTVPGIRVQPSGDGSTNVITSSRDPTGGCVTFYVDGAPWQQMTPGDLDTYVRPEEVAALEVYNGSTTPAQFQSAGQSGCTTIVIWTERRIGRKKD